VPARVRTRNGLNRPILRRNNGCLLPGAFAAVRRAVTYNEPAVFDGLRGGSSRPRLCRGNRFAFEQGDHLGAKQEDHDDNFDAEQGDDGYGNGTVNHIDHGDGPIIPDQHAPRYLPEGCSGDAADERVPEAYAGNGITR